MLIKQLTVLKPFLEAIECLSHWYNYDNEVCDDYVVFLFQASECFELSSKAKESLCLYYKVKKDDEFWSLLDNDAFIDYMKTIL